MAKKVTLHPLYNISKREHDIALIELKRGVTLSDYVQPICLPNTKEELKTGTKCVMTGMSYNIYLKRTNCPAKRKIRANFGANGATSCSHDFLIF